MSSGKSGVKHVVMFTLKDDLTAEQIEELKNGLVKLKDKLPDIIQTYELGIDLKLHGGQTHPAGKNRSVCWSVTFNSVQDYETYDASEAHTSLIANVIKTYTVPGTRAAVQYEF